MKNTKLIQLLKEFSLSELKRFGKFLNSPFFNESTLMIKLYDCLKEYYPDFEDKQFTKENIFFKIYGKAKFDDKKLRLRFSDMLRLAEHYLSVINNEKNPIEFKRQTLKEFANRGLGIHFDKTNKEINEILEKTKIHDIDYFRNTYQTVRDRGDFFKSKKLLGKRKTLIDEFALEVELFLRFFLSQMLSYYTIMENWEDNINYKFDYKLYEPLMKFVEENNLTGYPFIKACYLILKIRENEDDDSLYYELKETYINNADFLAKDDKKEITTMLFNDALKRFMRGKLDFVREEFEILKLQLEHNTYAEEQGWLTREEYINYVIVPVSLGNIKWAENFVNNYTNKVTPDKRNNAYHYVCSVIMFAKKKYEDSLIELSRIERGDFYYYLMIKTMHTMIYYEQDDFEKVLQIIDSLKHYISSNILLPQVLKKGYLNYSNILHKLTLLRFNEDEYYASNLINEIENLSINELITNKKWLHEKINELKDSVLK